jgi:hypothetical protein
MKMPNCIVSVKLNLSYSALGWHQLSHVAEFLQNSDEAVSEKTPTYMPALKTPAPNKQTADARNFCAKRGIYIGGGISRR